MSSGQAIPSIGDVMPDVYFPQPPVAETIGHTVHNTVQDTVQTTVQNTGVPQHAVHGTGLSDHVGTHVGQHIGDAVQQAGGHALNAAMDQLHDLMVPALIGLGSLSGALLVGRAAMAGAQVLAAAAIRAAEAQEELRGRQLEARQAAECWRDAAFAAARANARIDTLRARIRRAAASAGPDGPPDPPDLPPPLAPAGMGLDEVWRRLADTDRRLRQAEAAYARATMEAAARPVPGSHPEDTGWHTKLRARRRRALEAYQEAATETGARHAQPPLAATMAPVAAPTEEDVLRLGADLLAMLPRNVSVADYRLVEEKVTVAAEVAAQRPAAAKRHLREATRFAERVTREAERRQQTEEWAAQQLAFLRDDQAGTPVPLPDARAEIVVLERFLDQGGALAEAERVRVAARVGERVDAYQRMYAAEVIRLAVGRAEPETARYSTSGAVQVIDWTPPGWGKEHWLRLNVDAGGTARVATVHRERDPAEETDDDLDLDWQRCVQAPDHLRELRKLAERAGLSVPFVFDEPPARPVPRTAGRPARDHRTGPKVRHRDQEPQS